MKAPRYLVSRLAGSAVGFLVLSLAVFAMVRLIPGSVEDAYFGSEGASEEVRQAFRERYGLNEPLPVQYLTYMRNLFSGDLGFSIRVQEPVTEALLNTLRPSLELAVSAVLIALVVAFVAGTVAALREGRALDKAISMHSLLGVSVPDFLMGILLIALVATSVRSIPIFGYAPLSEGLYEWGRHMLLPAFSLSFVLLGYLTRLVRSSVIETLRSEHVRTARGKGLAQRPLLVHHIIRPSLIPIITTTGVLFVGAIGGVVVIEQVFAIPGVGRLVLEAIRWRDFSLIQGATLVIGTFAIVVNLLVDLSYRLIDPRVDG